MKKTKKIPISQVKRLLEEGKKIKVKSINGEFYPISNYIEKGYQPTYEVFLKNHPSSIKVTGPHLFFTNRGWVKTSECKPNIDSILCDDGKYKIIQKINFIGEHEIVDITVDHEDHCYFGNGMLNHNSGKSLLCAHIAKSTQQKGGIVVYIDTEASLDTRFLQAIGVNTEELIYLPLELIEEVWESVENIITKSREKDNKKIVTIIIDSQSAASTKIESEADFDKDGYATQKAIINSKALRKITNMIYQQKILLVVTNQLRQKMNAVAFGDQWTTNGGKALNFHASVILRASNVKKLKEDLNGIKQVIGRETKVTVTKNRVGPPERSANYKIYYDSGIDDVWGWLDIMKKYKIIKGGAAGMYSYIFDGEKIEFRSESGLKTLMEGSPKIKESMYNDICDMMIMKYQNENEIIQRDSENLTEEIENPDLLEDNG